MFERFSRAARDAVKAAQHEARTTHASEVRQEHLLLGVLAQADPDVQGTLADLGVTAGALREALQRGLRYPDGLDEDDAEALRSIGIELHDVLERLGGTERPSRSPREPSYSRQSKKALQLALREAVALGHPAIGADHILLGLARDPVRAVVDALTACGLDHRALRGAVDRTHLRAG
jgi:ATP-dependent Clp protease ATP-binding subunit ClpA